MKIQQVKYILKAYLLSKLTFKEKELVDTWYHSFDEEQSEELTKEKEDDIGHEIWMGIESEVNQNLHSAKRIFPYWLKAAAVLILIFSVSLLFRTTRVSGHDLYVTQPGEMKNIRMTDGTLLTLKGGSEISIQKNLSEERRVEIIDGEVFFDVKRDPSRPFIIKSGTMTTKVLGTAFTVSAYKELSTMSVEVLRGKVSVSPKNKDVEVLTKGYQLTYVKEKGTYTVTSGQGLTAGLLNINDVSFDDMATLIRKNFGIKILSEDKAIRKLTRYTASLPLAIKPSEAAEILAAIHKLKIKKSRNCYYFCPG